MATRKASIIFTVQQSDVEWESYPRSSAEPVATSNPCWLSVDQTASNIRRTFHPKAGCCTGCITLLDMNCCHSDGRSIRKADTLSTQLGDHLIIYITDDLVSKGAFTRCALYQAIGKQDVLLILSTTKPSRCWRCRTCRPNFSVWRSQLKYDEVEILSNSACNWPFFHWNCCKLPIYNIKVFHNQFPNSISLISVEVATVWSFSYSQPPSEQNRIG